MATKNIFVANEFYQRFVFRYLNALPNMTESKRGIYVASMTDGATDRQVGNLVS